MAISHAGHNHPSTPAARSTCRKLMAGGGGKPSVQRIESDGFAPGISTPAAVRNARLADMQARLESMADEPVRLTGAVARRMAKTAAKAERIQPRRGGARVAVDASGCVQAALHIDAHGGRCACGWAANRVAA